MKLHIKYMVSLRCKMIVKKELNELGLHENLIDLGLVDICEDITKETFNQLRVNLLRYGLDLMEDNKSILIDRIKGIIIEMIQGKDEQPKVNYSDYISEKLKYDYTYLSNIFSRVKGITIQHYIIIRKIEKVKELILCGQFNLSEISYKLHYSSVGHLSNQFKKITGLSPSFYKKITQKRMLPLESI